jgi:hypothetical protein
MPHETLHEILRFAQDDRRFAQDDNGSLRMTTVRSGRQRFAQDDKR